jgi:hypothetical protein
MNSSGATWKGISIDELSPEQLQGLATHVVQLRLWGAWGHASKLEHEIERALSRKAPDEHVQCLRAARMI